VAGRNLDRQAASGRSVDQPVRRRKGSGIETERGTHDELLALNGYYSDLYNKQLLEEELAEV
jgi:hypothetical protein